MSQVIKQQCAGHAKDDPQSGYHVPAKADYFEFDKSVADVFDNMAARSIPGYAHFWQLVTNIVNARKIQSYTQVWDMGVSTGAGLDAVRRGVFHPYLDYFGIDISESMLAKASERCPYAKMSAHDLRNGLPDVAAGNVSIFIFGWTLQFLSSHELRKRLIKDAAAALCDKGIIFVGEKYSLDDAPEICEVMQDAYISWRRQNGYSLEEIKAKTIALKGSMSPWLHSDLIQCATEAGLVATPLYRQFACGGYMLHK
jgi:tRNA (cmo5U34)-methyltransferase